MITYDADRVRKAVQFLVDSSYSIHHITKLRTTVGKPRSLPFKDEAECLNELLLVGRQSLQAMENLIEVAEAKRGGRNEYQKNYMAAKRRRDRKVIQLEELLTGGVLPPKDRITALQRSYVVWNHHKDELMKSLEGESWKEKNERAKEFWDDMERALDARIAAAMERGPVKRKRVVQVAKPEPKSEFGRKLLTATKRS